MIRDQAGQLASAQALIAQLRTTLGVSEGENLLAVAELMRERRYAAEAVVRDLAGMEDYER